MSALWTPGRAGARVRGSCRRARLLRHGPSCTAPVPAVYAGSRWSWFDAGPAQNWLEMARVGLLHEGRDPLAKGCAYCTKAPPTRSTPNPPPVAPHPRAVHPGDAGSHRTDRVSPSGRLKPQLSRPAGAPTLSPSPRSYLMSRARGLRVRTRDLTYDRGRRGGAAEVGCQESGEVGRQGRGARWRRGGRGGAPGVGCRRGVPAGRRADPAAPHLEPTRLKAYSRLPRTGAWPGRRPG